MYTAVDNYAFLRNWLSVFANYRTHDLWITGESYGGVYVPMLADQIINGYCFLSSLPPSCAIHTCSLRCACEQTGLMQESRHN
jgi:hypothetical protein